MSRCLVWLARRLKRLSLPRSCHATMKAEAMQFLSLRRLPGVLDRDRVALRPSQRPAFFRILIRAACSFWTMTLFSRSLIAPRTCRMSFFVGSLAEIPPNGGFWKCIA
jgi:hypothetical protein